jgi:hypothetical protein
MKKALVISLVLVAAAFTLGSVSKVFAQSETPTAGVIVNNGYGVHGSMMGGNQQGLLHDEMVKVIAEKLGITVDDLNARLADGETMYSIALAEGLTTDEAKALLLDARNQAIDQAVTNGDLTQAQADWMKTRANQMGGNGATRTRGMMNGNRGANGTGTCMGTYKNN